MEVSHSPLNLYPTFFRISINNETNVSHMDLLVSIVAHESLLIQEAFDVIKMSNHTVQSYV